MKVTVTKLVPKNLTPIQDRASFIAMLCRNGVSYASAVREYDRTKKLKEKKK